MVREIDEEERHMYLNNRVVGLVYQSVIGVWRPREKPTRCRCLHSLMHILYRYIILTLCSI